MSLNLKHIPCPAGNRCTAFQCIFGHDKDKVEHQAIQPDTIRQDPADADQQSPPRKRARVDNGTPSDQAQRPPRPASISDETASGTSSCKKESVNRRPESFTRPVSPPPLRRPAVRVSHEVSSASSTPKKAPSSEMQRTPGSASSKQPKTLPPQGKLKTESLNPRLLKSSPASHEVRLKLVRMLHAEYTRLNKELRKDASPEDQKLLLSDQELITKALDEEQALALGKAAVYANIMKNKVMQYKRMAVAQWKKERVEAVASENKNEKDYSESSDKPKKIETGLTAAQEVQVLKRLTTPIDELSKHGYVPAVPSEESIKSARDGKEAGQGWEKCDRCQQRFQVFPGRRAEDGALTSGGTCRFHWGKTYIPSKPAGDKSRPPKRYQCCGEEVGESSGCDTHDHHVYKATDAKTLATVLNFAETPANELVPADRAVCFDCEMCYTVHGMELVRLTAVAWPTGEELLDVLVRPLGEILDLNSRYSGVRPEHLALAKPWSATDDPTPSKSGGEGAGSEDGEIRSRDKELRIVSSPEIARDLLFSLISPSTFLIGHGLENDLNAVRVVHPTLIDTVLLYPHQGGLPYRYGLKMLMDRYLNRKIQQETGKGHDSAEDARAAGDLVRLRVEREWGQMRRMGWRIVDGELVPPGKS